MKFELKDFQTTTARGILGKLDAARNDLHSGELQAIVLSAPTGSGKTITVAAVIDWTFGGADGIPARPNTTFLWLSDSPELNQQSKGSLREGFCLRRTLRRDNGGAGQTVRVT